MWTFTLPTSTCGRLNAESSYGCLEDSTCVGTHLQYYAQRVPLRNAIREGLFGEVK